MSMKEQHLLVGNAGILCLKSNQHLSWTIKARQKQATFVLKR